MRSLILATSVALALGSVSAIGLARATSSNNAATSTTATTTTTSSATTEGVTTAAPSTSGNTSTPNTVGGGASSASGTNTTTTANTNSGPSFGPGSPFSNDSGNTALQPNNDAGIVGPGPAATNPEGTVLGSTGVNVVGERVLAQASQAQANPSVSVLNTPTFDQAAREGRAKIERRRARGDEPRVYGIAPRTENELTWQMPDDRVIRY